MKRIGIIGAMDVEVDILKKEMTIDVIEKHAGLAFYVGTWQEKPVVVVRSGIGKVNAALCTQILADQYDIGLVINTGVAGALADGLRVGDIVISTDAIEHDMDTTHLGDTIGWVPGMDVRAFPADRELSNLALAAGRDVLPHLHLIQGTILSGDQFIDDPAKKHWLKETFSGACCEMEGASIAHVAHVNKIPYLVLRGISDNADGSAGITYEEFLGAAVINITDLVREVVGRLLLL